MSAKGKGRKASLETRELQSKQRRGTQTGKDNPMFGRCAYDIWVEKYGIEEADRKREQQVRKSIETKKNCNVN